MRSAFKIYGGQVPAVEAVFQGIAGQYPAQPELT